jgi:hypothetical protein
MKRYRLWRKDGSYEVGVGYTKSQAQDYAIARDRIKAEEIQSITLASH